MAPKLKDRPIFVIEQGGTAEVAFDAIDGRIDSIIRTALLSRCKLNPCREITKE
jgi:hypothetical protein